MNIEKLENTGLSPKQASVYLALLELEIATVNQIAKKAEINRSSTYVILESLMNMGMVSISKDKKIRHYLPASPEKLLRIVEESAKKHTEILERIKAIIPELKARHKDTKHKPIVRVFEGINGVKETYNDILSTNSTELRTYSDPENLIKVFNDFSEQHNTPRMKMGVKIFLINPATKFSRNTLKKLPPHIPDEIVLIPEEKFKFPCDMAIYGDRVAFVSIKEEFGIIIEHKEIAATLRNSFNLAWEESKRLDKSNRKIVKVSRLKRKLS